MGKRERRRRFDDRQRAAAASVIELVLKRKPSERTRESKEEKEKTFALSFLNRIIDLYSSISSATMFFDKTFCYRSGTSKRTATRSSGMKFCPSRNNSIRSSSTSSSSSSSSSSWLRLRNEVQSQNGHLNEERRRLSVSLECTGRDDAYLELSSTARRLKPSSTVAMTDLATEMKQGGMDVISLSVGEPDFNTPERIAGAGRKAIEEGFTKYSPNAGLSQLREAIARKLQRENGIEGLSAANVVVTNGAKQAIAETVLATCSPGDEVIVPSPYWVSYPEIARLAGAEPVIVETNLEENFLLTAEKLEACLTPKSRVLILCSPSNPTGSVYSRKQMEELARVAVKHPRLLVISDEIYEHIYYETGEEGADSGSDAFPASFASCGVEGALERSITINGFSKSFAMTGWRVGYLAAPESIAKAAAKVQSQFTSGASSIAQFAAAEALAICEEEPSSVRGGRDVQDMVEEFRKRRDYACERFEKIGGIQFPYSETFGAERCKPSGAFYLFPDVSSWIADTKSESSDELCMRILKEAGVALVPGSAFGKDSCLRMSYATSMENLEKAFDKIENWLKTMKINYK